MLVVDILAEDAYLEFRMGQKLRTKLQGRLVAQGRAYFSFNLRLPTPCHHLLHQFEPALPIRLP